MKSKETTERGNRKIFTSIKGIFFDQYSIFLKMEKKLLMLESEIKTEHA